MFSLYVKEIKGTIAQVYVYAILVSTWQQLVLRSSLAWTAAEGVNVKMVECVTHWTDTVPALQDGQEHTVSSVSLSVCLKKKFTHIVTVFTALVSLPCIAFFD